MGTPQNETIRIRPGTKLLISEQINYEVVRTDDAAESWQIIGPPSLIVSTRWLRRDSLKLTMPAGNSCSITIKVHRGAQPHITRCR